MQPEAPASPPAATPPTASTTVAPPPSPVLRRRLVTVVAVGQVVASCGQFAAVAMATVLAADLLGGATWAGLASTAAILGSAVASLLLGGVAARHGRRPGLALGYATAAVGALIVLLGARAASFPVVALGMAAVGAGTAAGLQARFAAADAGDPARRAQSIGLVVWAGTVGAVVGPNLVGPMGPVSDALDLPPAAGPYVFSLLAFVVAATVATVLLRPDPATLVPEDVEPAPAGRFARPGDASARPPMRSVLALPEVRLAILGLAAFHLAMVMVMTMTPVVLRGHDHELSFVGFVISLHVLGMYAPSPLTGYAVARLGPVPVMGVGVAVMLVATGSAALADPADGTVLCGALFLLGTGWNLGFVGGSALLTAATPTWARARAQGLSDATMSTAGAMAAASAGVVQGLLGYPAVGVLGALAMVVPLALLAARRRTTAAAAGA